MKDYDLVEKSVIIDKGVELEVIKFCYLGDMLDADSGVDSAVTARVRYAWNKFKELRPFLTAKSLPAGERTLLGCKGSIPAGERKGVQELR
jgi:hypothetical protein